MNHLNSGELFMISMVISGLLGIAGIGVMYVGLKKIKTTDKSEKMPWHKRRKIVVGLGGLLIVSAVMVLVAGTVMSSGAKTENKDPKKESVSSSSSTKKMLKVDKKTVTLKDGKAKINVELNKDTKLEIKNVSGSVDSIKYDAKKHPQKLNVAFVVAGKYELIATQKNKKTIEKVTVKKDPKSVSSTTEVVEPEIEDELVTEEEPVVEEETNGTVPTNDVPVVQQPQSNWVPQITEVVPNDNAGQSSVESHVPNEAPNVETDDTSSTSENTDNNNVTDETVTSDETSNQVVENDSEHGAASSN